MSDPFSQTSLTFLRFPWDRFIDRVINDGTSPISSLAVLSTSGFLEKESKTTDLTSLVTWNILTQVTDNDSCNRIAQRNLPKLTESDAQSLVARTLNGTLHKELLKLTAEKQYVITTVQERSYLGRSTNTFKGGGILVYLTNRVVLIATYESPVLQSEAVVYFEPFVEEVTTL